MTANLPMPAQLAIDHVSPATRLLEKRRQLAEVQEQLEQQKREYSLREETFKKREETLRLKDLQLQECLIKFNKYLEENEQKYRDEMKKADEEIRLRADEEKRIKEKTKELEKYTLKCQKKREKFRRNKKYLDFLWRVKEEHSADYMQVDSITRRYKCLEQAFNEMSKVAERAMANYEEKRLEFMNRVKDQGNKILGLDNEIARLQKELEDAETRTHKLEQELDANRQDSAERTREISEILMAVDFLYNRSLKYTDILNHKETDIITSKDGGGDKEIEKTDSEQKRDQALQRLAVIANYICDFLAIWRLYEQKQKGEQRSVEYY